MRFQFLGCTILMGRAILKHVALLSITLAQYGLMHVLEWEKSKEKGRKEGWKEVGGRKKQDF